jgi:GGDEF domain-containing protein
MQHPVMPRVADEQPEIDRLRSVVGCLGTQDTASRFGGDELVILHPRVRGGSELALGAQILATVAKAIVIRGEGPRQGTAATVQR